jgi:gliding motility-associated-like protein
MKKTWLTILWLTLYLSAYAQKEGFTWYFGNKAGISFNGFPRPLKDGAMSTLEGCASISDYQGNLLFYTNGVDIWDRSHRIMSSGLEGSTTSTQSAIIIPQPGHPNIYFLYTIVNTGVRGLCYSIVNMKVAGGLGFVQTKNVKLDSGTFMTEKLTAVQHANQTDYWVIVHRWESNQFYAYLVNDSGVSKNPVVSAAGVYHGGQLANSIGYMKASPGGNKLACVLSANAGLGQVFDFDNSTGIISNPVSLPGLAAPYGVEFSPDNSKLYVSGTRYNELIQYEVDKDSATIINSRTLIFKSDSNVNALQLAPDGKIYVARNGKTRLGLIQNPNIKGISCQYNETGFSLDGRVCNQGLPTFNQSFFIPVSSFTYSNACAGDSVHFTSKSNVTPDYISWDFGDPVTNFDDYSSLPNPAHRFSGEGNFTVRLVVGLKGVYDTIVKIIPIKAPPKLNLGKQLVFCSGQPASLDAANPGMGHLWNTGDTGRVLQISTSGLYWARVSNGGCEKTDSVRVTFISIADFNLGNDTVFCEGSTFSLKKAIPGVSLLWSTGDTGSTVQISHSGSYWLKASLAGCSFSDTIAITLVPPPKVNLGADTTLCEGDTAILDAGNPGAGYLWSTGETQQKIKIHQGGDYWVIAKAANCLAADTIHILHCPAKVYIPNVFSPNSDNTNEQFCIYGSDIIKGELTIFNRWGEVVYKSNDIHQCWDGSRKGELCPEGMYAWSLLYWRYEGDIQYNKLLKGTVLLQR